MPEITCSNKYHLEPGWERDEHYVYIGRKKSGMHFGNPFSCRPYSIAEVKVDTREESIESFHQWLLGNKDFAHIEPERRVWILDNMHLLRGKTLVCFCYPKPCHGNVYDDWLK